MLSASRPPLRCRNGVVAAPHSLASLAGARMLLEGGNAVDAAIAADAVLTVVYPHNCTIGGDAFWLIYSAADGTLQALNGSGRAPRRANPAEFAARGLRELPYQGILTVTVPGVVDSWAEALARHGSLPLAQVLAPAIAYAHDGFAVSGKLAAAFAEDAGLLGGDPGARAAWFSDGQLPRAGQVWRQPELGRTLEALAAGGRDEFYRGATARAIAAASRALGGLLDEQDLATHHSDWVEPIGTGYRGLDVYEFPPNTQGILALMLLNVVEGFDLGAYGPGSADAVHVFAEAKKLVYPTRERYLSDPEFVDIPVARLTSKAYAEELRGRIDSRRARFPRQGVDEDGDTIYLCVVDGRGNAVSLIQSVYAGFGSGVVAPGSGVLLQNRGASFSLDPRHPNVIAPGKRTFHTLTPGMALKDGRPWLVFGTMGGSIQPQVQAQVLTNVVDFGMDAQRALDFPRWSVGGMQHDDLGADVVLEEPYPAEVAAELERRGHPVVRMPAGTDSMGHAHAIRVYQENGVLEAGADPRSDGAAIGW